MFGDQFQRKLGSKHFFVVGTKAIGCELIKIMAMMGIGAHNDGRVYVTNDSVSTKKTTTTAADFKEINPNFNIILFNQHVGPETEFIFDEKFFRKLDGVAITVDNDDSRLFVDQRCLKYCKSIIDFRALGTRGYVQVVIPRLTQDYATAEVLIIVNR